MKTFMCVLLLIIVIGSLAGLLLITLLDLTRFPPRYSNFGQSLLRPIVRIYRGKCIRCSFVFYALALKVAK